MNQTALLSILRTRAVAWLVCTFVLAGAGALFLKHCTIRIEPGEVGVRLAELRAGNAARDYGPGLYFKWPAGDPWRRISRRTHFVDFGTRAGAVPVIKPAPATVVAVAVPGGALEIRTRDNNPASVALLATYRPRAGEAFELVRAGLDGLYSQRVRSTVEDVLRTQLANLGSEEWFDTDLRQAQIDKARAALSDAFVPLHMEVGDLMLQGVTFTKEYEEQLQLKQIGFQNKRRAEAQAKVEEAQQELSAVKDETLRTSAERTAAFQKELEVESASGEMAIAGVKARAQSSVAKIKSEADAAYAKILASADRVLAQARAQAKQLRLAALHGPGGRVYLASQLLQALNVKEASFDSAHMSFADLLDIEPLIKSLAGS